MTLREALAEFDAGHYNADWLIRQLRAALAARPSESFSHFDGTSQCVHPARPSDGSGGREALREALFDAVGHVIREGIDSPGAYDELHRAYYSARDGKQYGTALAARPSGAHPVEGHRPEWMDDVPTGWCECGKPYPCVTASQEQDDMDAMEAGNFV